MATKPADVPVTTIGGYLGAGKTTLLNAVLTGDHGRRIGVLVNDFGSVSIDEQLIVARDGDVVTLANGCACCSVAGDLGEALDNLVRSRSRPDHILLEASGVADPGRIAALARSPGLEPRAPVVLVDAETIVARSRDKFVGRLVRKQLSEAGLVVINKVDLVDANRLAAVRALVAREAPGAKMIETSRGALEPDLLFDAGGPAPSAFLCDEPDEADASFESYRWSTQDIVDLQLLASAFEKLPPHVVRAKGVIAAADGSFEIHRVGDRVNVERLPKIANRVGADLVFIALAGTLDREALDAALRICSTPGSDRAAV
jgi:G3E family GTPase